MGASNKRKEEIAVFLTKENLKNAYLEGYSSNHIAKKYFAPKFTCDTSTVIKYAKSFGLNPPNIKKSANLKSVRQKYKNTNIKKYGVENISQNNEIKEKKKRKALEVYGVENVFQSEEIKKKSRQTCLDKYGIEYPGCLSKQSGQRSKFHIEIEECLKGLNIEFKSEVYNKFKKFNPILNREYNPIVDILIEKYRTVIECHGDLWHANPKIYKKDDVIYKYKGAETAEEIWKFDDTRNKQIRSFGYKLIIIWNKDWVDNPESIKKILNDIKNKKNRKN